MMKFMNMHLAILRLDFPSTLQTRVFHIQVAPEGHAAKNFYFKVNDLISLVFFAFWRACLKCWCRVKVLTPSWDLRWWEDSGEFIICWGIYTSRKSFHLSLSHTHTHTHTHTHVISIPTDFYAALEIIWSSIFLFPLCFIEILLWLSYP